MKTENYPWANNLKVGDNFIIKDNSYCYQIINNKIKKVLLHPSYHEDYENPYELYITKITKGIIGKGIFKKNLPIVYLKSKVTNNIYKIGICWYI